MPTLTRSKGQWLVGDWKSLAALDAQTLAQHPDRDRLALLVACAHQQRAEHDRARECTRQALAWGCDARLVARLLVSGLHNTLGRIAALKADNPMLERHFAQAMAVTGEAESNVATPTRAVREMASLGLLPQAAQLIQGELDTLDASSQRPAVVGARVEMLRSEVELLQHELSLALKRGQVGARAYGSNDSSLQGGRDSMQALRSRSTSQLGQDLWVLERSEHKRRGFFVEFGATDGVRLSNTYLLEKQFEWRGICAEPNPTFFAQLQRNRNCIVTDACIGRVSGERVEFVLAAEYGGMVRHMMHDQHAAKREAYAASAAHQAVFETVSLHDLLVRLGAPHVIDYLSIDIEGGEYEVLAAFPFDRWDVRLITVEHNHGPTREKIRCLLEPMGYERTEAQWDDWYERRRTP